jgi:hypothetical protein
MLVQKLCSTFAAYDKYTSSDADADRLKKNPVNLNLERVNICLRPPERTQHPLQDIRQLSLEIQDK